MTRWVALLLAIAMAACTAPRSSRGSEEQLGATSQAFDSNESVLLDFTIDGTLTSHTADEATVRALIEAQLVYTVGILNHDRSVGRFERLELPVVSIAEVQSADASSDFTVTYRAKLPVAWGAPAKPTSYSFVVPARVDEPSRVAFASKYGSSCVDPFGPVVDAWTMFLHYRPQRVGCVLDDADIATLTATVEPSTENTTGKYPEYHRIWDDGALDVVALFSREHYEPTSNDGGATAFTEFVAEVDEILAERQPDVKKRVASASSASRVKRAATLPDGRVVRVDVALVSAKLADESSDFDVWFDALTPNADLILYNGHAGHGENVRAFAKKGAFVPKKYALLLLNGCDTFAYVDRTLAERRALLNPDDPSGTKYLDVVSNVLAGYFSTTSATSLAFIDAALAARDPGGATPSYRQIFGVIDPAQVVVVTGEEDNEFHPAMLPGSLPGGGAGSDVTRDPADARAGWTEPKPYVGARAGDAEDGMTTRSERACSMSHPPGSTSATTPGAAHIALAVVALAACASRRRPRVAGVR